MSENLENRRRALSAQPVGGEVGRLVAEQAAGRMPFVTLIEKYAGVMDLNDPRWHDRKEPPTQFVIDSCDTENVSLPLPVTHADVCKIVDGKPVIATRAEADADPDKTMIRFAARRVGEALDQTFLGLPFGPVEPLVPGLCTLPDRMTYTYPAPDPRPTDRGPGWLVETVMKCIDLQRANRFYGPWALLTGRAGDRELDANYGPDVRRWELGDAGRPVRTVRQVILTLGDPGEKGEGYIQALHSVPYAGWPEDRVALVQITPDVARAVKVAEPRLIPWAAGYKVVACVVPLYRRDFYGNAGVVEATSDRPAAPTADAPVYVGKDLS